MNEELLSDADLWELKVREGMPKDQATAYVRSRVRATPQGAGGTWTPDPVNSGRPDFGEMGRQVDTLRQGMFIPGLADEVGAAVRSIPSLIPGGESPREAFTRNLADERASVEQYAEENPGASTALQVMGALGTARFLPQASGRLRSVKEGAAYGGASAAAMAEGDIGDRLRAAPTGAGIGAALGPVAEGVVKGAGKVGTYLADVSGVRAIADRLARFRSGSAPGAEPRFTAGGAAPHPDRPPPMYPRAGADVDGLRVGDQIPNRGSVDANWSFEDEYTVLPGVRSVPMEGLHSSPHDLFYAADDIQRTRRLAETIRKSGRIDPLIVAVDDDGPWVMEGAHRLGALNILGKREFPALVVRDETALSNPELLERLYTAGGSPADDPILATTQERADEKLVEALRRANRTTADVGAGINRRDPRVPITLQEEVGQPMQRLGRAVDVASGGGSARQAEALRGRGLAQEERILNDLLETTGLRQRSGVVETVDELTRRRAQEAAPLYEAAFSNPNARRITDPEILALLERPSMRNALSRARQLADEEGAPLVDDVLDLRTLDYIKRALDDDLFLGRQARMTGQGGLGPGMERAALENRAKLLARLDELVPEYAQARAASAGPAAERAAFESGLDLFKMRPAEAQKLLGQMGDAEREQFRRGAMEALSERLEGTSQRFDVTKRRPLDDSTLDRQRLRLLFDSEEGFKAFTDRLADEVRMAQTQGFVLGGSNTANKFADLADLAGVDLADVLAGAATRPATIPGMIADRLLRSGIARHVSGRTEALADAMEPSLTAGIKNRDELLEVLRRLRAAEGRMGRRRVGQEARARAATTLGAGSSGRQ